MILFCQARNIAITLTPHLRISPTHKESKFTENNETNINIMLHIPACSPAVAEAQHKVSVAAQLHTGKLKGIAILSNRLQDHLVQ